MRRVQTDHFSPQQPIILVGNFSEKQRCTFEPSQDGISTKPRSILSQRSALAAEKQGHFCPFEGKLQRLLCFSPHSFLLLGVWYAEDVRGCLRKSWSEIWFKLRHMREAMSPEERQHTKSCGLGALKHDGQTSWGFQDHILDMGNLHSLVLCKVLWFLGDFTRVGLHGLTFLHDGMIPASHYFYLWKPPWMVTEVPYVWTFLRYQKVFRSFFFFLIFSFSFFNFFFFLFFFFLTVYKSVDYKPWGQLMHHFRSGADSSRQHCPTHLEDVHISPISFQVLWSVSGASPSNSAHSAFYPLYYSSVLTHKTFQTLEMVQCIMVFKNIQYLCLNEKNKYLGSFCTCQQYSVKQYV